MRGASEQEQQCSRTGWRVYQVEEELLAAFWTPTLAHGEGHNSATQPNGLSPRGGFASSMAFVLPFYHPTVCIGCQTLKPLVYKEQVTVGTIACKTPAHWRVLMRRSPAELTDRTAPARTADVKSPTVMTVSKDQASRQVFIHPA